MPNVPLYRLIWIKRGIPKHQTLSWLMLLNRSPTKDHLLSSGLQTDPQYLLCSQGNESRDHLFFTHSFSAAIWSYFSPKFGVTSTLTTWNDVAHSLLSQSGNRNLTYLSIITWQATIYNLWWERNERFHRGTRRPSGLLIKKISSTIKNKISSLRPQQKWARQ